MEKNHTTESSAETVTLQLARVLYEGLRAVDKEAFMTAYTEDDEITIDGNYLLRDLARYLLDHFSWPPK